MPRYAAVALTVLVVAALARTSHAGVGQDAESPPSRECNQVEITLGGSLAFVAGVFALIISATGAEDDREVEATAEPAPSSSEDCTTTIGEPTIRDLQK